MKNVLFILFGAVVVSFGAYSLHREYRSGGIPEHEAVFEDLRWLREEFGLEASQMEAIARVYEEYRPVCEALCLRVMETQDRLDALLLESETVTPELREVLAEYARVKEECHRAMLEHVYEVAAHMTPPQRERYLERARAHVTMHDARR